MRRTVFALHRRVSVLGILWIAIFSAAGSPTSAGTIQGTIRSASTSAPIAGIDLDVFDDRLRLDSGVTAVTGPDGSYSLANVNGDVFVRADPTLAQGYVDRFWPGSFLPSGAQLIPVGSNDTVTGIDFYLEQGTIIRGVVLASDTSGFLSGCDIDVIAPDGTFLSGVDAVTGPDGRYEIGQLPIGEYLVKADPTLAQGYVPEFHPGAFDMAGGVPVVIASTAPVDNVDFVVEPGGEIAGRVLESGTLVPAVGVDLDLFDVLFAPRVDFDAAADELGSYSLGIVPVGTYYVLADAIFDQPWVDTFFGQSTTIELATPVTVTKGEFRGDVDIVIDRQGFLAGTVTDAVTGLALAGIDLDVLDLSTALLPDYDATTGADGSYRIGPIPPGSYLLRADPGPTEPWVDRYQPGTFALSAALPITVGTDVVTGLDFALERGGWIRGGITRASDGQIVPGVDLDVFLPGGEAIPSVDGDSDALGAYRMGALPPGPYVVRADPEPSTGLSAVFWPQSELIGGAQQIQVLLGLDTPQIDFVLDASPATTSPVPAKSGLEILTPPHPNPFAESTTFRFRVGARSLDAVDVFDVRGRRVRRIVPPRHAAGDEILLQWSGRDDGGRPLASGVYFLRLGAGPGAQVLELLRVR